MLSSLSARRAWIEIAVLELVPLSDAVALRKESVDRNHWAVNIQRPTAKVALRKESVDRNTLWEVLNLDRWVALRKESVDRNNAEKS